MGAVAGPLTKSSPRTLGEAARDAHGSNVAASSMTGMYLRVILTALCAVEASKMCRVLPKV